MVTDVKTINNKEEFANVVDSLSFTFAKTFAKTAPHEYAMADEGTKELEIIRALNKYIQKHGEIEKFWDKVYQVVYVKSHKYWSVGEWHVTRFLNRNWDYIDSDGLVNRTITESRKELRT